MRLLCLAVAAVTCCSSVAQQVSAPSAQAVPAPAQRPGGPNSGPAPQAPALTGDALQKPGVPVGGLSEKLTLRSAVYDGMTSDYWIYVPAQYDARNPAALMVFQDGEGYLNRKGDHPALNVIDNLIAEGKIPVMIAVFTNPGDIQDRRIPRPIVLSTRMGRSGAGR